MVGQMQRSEHILQYDLVLLLIPKQNWGPLVSTSEKKWLQMGLEPTSSQNNFWAYLFMYRNSLYFFYHFYRPSGVHWQLISWIVYQKIAWESSEMIYWIKKKKDFSEKCKCFALSLMFNTRIFQLIYFIY